ncbi:DUF4123 domain-containing protein [Pseudorhodoferax sp. Leaf274]|uniref:DUF4123 domain-containing protein n=1 Tax=Pseudorhodoferax sp. Leaf274 TaxID=1736318 RepID=UPI000702EBA0|nr:DUF4123 domain-containing protein [Pseudorhodoferax sp. Leaf274]KQP35434.1 hypothetical protein ASF44_19005 [Pseudorhodoferax sp. Leaf274]
MSTPAAATPAALSPAQLKAALWADAALRVYALVLGRNVPGLAGTLAEADAARALDSYDCLWPGALAPQQRRQAPYLVALRQDSPFTDWLLQQAAADFGEWGVLMRSSASFLALRSHCRALCKARLGSGQEIALDWMDPPVLRALLSLASADQVEEMLAPMQGLVVVGTDAWTLCAQQFGRLTMTRQPVMAAA